MDPCLPGVSIADARTIARVKLGVPPQYVNKMSVAQVCRAMKLSKTTSIVPPMEYKTYKGKTYLIDPKSPLKINEFIMFINAKTLQDVAKIAKILSLVTEYLSKKELKTNIIQVLNKLNIAEPIELPSTRIRGLAVPNGVSVDPNGPMNSNIIPASNNRRNNASNNNRRNNASNNNKRNNAGNGNGNRRNNAGNGNRRNTGNGGNGGNGGRTPVEFGAPTPNGRIGTNGTGRTPVTFGAPTPNGRIGTNGTGRTPVEFGGPSPNGSIGFSSGRERTPVEFTTPVPYGSIVNAESNGRTPVEFKTPVPYGTIGNARSNGRTPVEFKKPTPYGSIGAGSGAGSGSGAGATNNNNTSVSSQLQSLSKSLGGGNERQNNIERVAKKEVGVGNTLAELKKSLG
jgi:hypothetical protein